jgi:hypothetical protein
VTSIALCATAQYQNIIGLGMPISAREDLIASAINDAVNKVAKMKKEKMAAITAGIPLPPGFQMPF